MFNGEVINPTEGRSVLHTALRRPASDTVQVEGENVIPLIHETLERIKLLSEEIKNKKRLGVTGKPIDTIISIGIGGSDLGPRMVYQALSNKPSDVIFCPKKRDRQSGRCSIHSHLRTLTSRCIRQTAVWRAWRRG